MMKLSLLPLLTLWSLVFAANLEEQLAGGVDGHAKATYFVNSGYVFALNVVENGDVYYHMHASAQYSWFGVGFGSSMSNTRMLISYLAADGVNLTNSCRMSYGNSEPEHDPDCVIEPVNTDGYAPFENRLTPDGLLIAHAVCRNCASWLGGGLDINNQEQPFIYALGPNITLHSDDLNAPLRLHDSYGTFNMNMSEATNTTGSYGRVPAPQDPGLETGHGFWAFANYYSSTPYNTGTLADWSPTAHAVFMCLAFLLIFPLGAISLRLLRRAIVHAAAQMLGLVFVLIGFAFGIYASKLYNKSKHFNSAHQIIGLIIFAALFIQIGLGLSHHLLFIRSGVPTILGTIHRILGLSTIVLAIINGGLGLHFAQTSALAYAIVVAILALIYAAIAAFIYRHNRQHTYKPEKEFPARAYEMRGGYIQTPRTPFFADQAAWDADPDNFRAHLVRSNSGRESLYAESTPAEDLKDPFKGKWEGRMG